MTNQLSSYLLPQHLHIAAVYPFLAPNDSEIIVCGHDHGLLILWRGGRPFKTAAPGLSKETTATSSELVVLDDSDDEQTPPAPAAPEFVGKNELRDFDPRKPYHAITQHLDLPLGTTVLDLSFPRLPCLATPAEREDVRPALLQHKLVVALACADSTIKILTLPLAPPSPASKQRELCEDPAQAAAGRGNWGEQLITIDPVHAHRKMPRGVSLAFAPHSAVADGGDEDDEDEDEDMQGNSQDRTPAFDAIVASHSAELSGTVLIHRIPISSDEDGLDWIDGERMLYRRIRLSSPASSIDLLAPPAHPANPPLHPVRLLIAPTMGSVQVFDCRTPIHGDGAFVLSFSPGFASHASHGMPQHRRVQSVRWALAGKAIAVLLDDGEWGLWDPLPSSSKSMAGAVPSPFMVSGRIGRDVPARSGPAAASMTASGTISKSSTGRQTSASALAPMTPGARKIRQAELFARPAGSLVTESSISSSAAPRGGITVMPLDPTAEGAAGGGPDDLVIFWQGNRAIGIPGLCAHWASLRGARPGSAGGRSGLRRYEIPSWASDLGGDTAAAAGALPAEIAQAHERGEPLAPDLFVAGERTLCMLARLLEPPSPPSPQDQESEEDAGDNPIRPAEDAHVLAIDDETKMMDGLKRKDLSPEAIIGALDRIERREEARRAAQDEDLMQLDGAGLESPSVRASRKRTPLRR